MTLLGLKQRASVLRRSRLRNLQVPLFRRSLNAPLTQEIAALLARLADGISALDDWLDDFYPEHELEIIRSVRPVVTTYGTQVTEMALEEVDEPDAAVPVGVFAAEYLTALASRWSDSSIAQMRQIIRDEPEPEAAIIDRLDKWQATRAVWGGEREATQAGSAFVKLAFLTVGVQQLVWRTVSPCDICAPMEGRVVGINSPFLEAGAEVGGQGESNAFQLTQTIGHPPLHGLDGRGGVCQCTIAAA